MIAKLGFLLLTFFAFSYRQAPTAEDRAAALRDPKHPLWSRPAPDVYRVQIETTKGRILLEVTRALAPRGADRFCHLVESGFYIVLSFPACTSKQLQAGKPAHFVEYGHVTQGIGFRHSRFRAIKDHRSQVVSFLRKQRQRGIHTHDTPGA